VIELAEIFRDAGPAYVQRFGDRLLPSHRRVLRDIAACRTPALGGQMYLCPRCGHEHSVYHSCRNRHCPKCQGAEAERWLEKQRSLLLPCEYGFATCTVPAGLREVARSHQREVYSILMREAAHALLEILADRRFVGGLTAVMAVLHTWTRAMDYHPHVHLLFPIGGMADDGKTWIKPAKPNYVLPAFGLAKVFRERVERAFRTAGLHELVLDKVWRRRWVAHVKPVGDGEKALLYLSRYVFRIAISNERILAFNGKRVTFNAKDRTGRVAPITVDVEEFIRRYLQHVLPKSFVKVRYYGLWASPSRHKLETARKILEHHLKAVGKTARPRNAESPLIPARPRCPICGAPYEDPPTPIPRPRAPP
jgi:hypothetical protein